MQKMPFKSIIECKDIKGKYIFLRASINVPIVREEVKNQFRITRGLATVRYLVDKGARVIIAGHIGRDGKISTKAVADIFAKKMPTVFSSQVLGEETQKLRNSLKDGEVLFIENLRSCKEEAENDLEFAKNLASLADIYVNDAFAASHREHASLSAITKFLPSYAGLNFVNEYTELKKAITPDVPSLFLIGGAKFDTKIPLLEKFLDIYDNIFIGGALANDFFKARGFELGSSMVSDIVLPNSLSADNSKILLPIDVVAVKDGVSRVTTPDNVNADECILDMGPKTVQMLSGYIKNAKMILWNGPFGDYEKGFESQTSDVAKLIAEDDSYSIVGGGDTVASIDKLDVQEKFNFLSTAGGAMLVFLESETLPAIEALNTNPNKPPNIKS